MEDKNKNKWAVNTLVELVRQIQSLGTIFYGKKI